MQTFNQIERVYAGFWARAAAFAIDCVIVWVLRLIVRFALFLSFGIFQENNPLDSTLLFQYSWKDGLLYGAGILYFVLCTYYAGATLGKKALNLRVVSADGGRLTFVNVLYRETVGRFLSSFVLCLGYLLAGITNDKKALHDMLCDTRVIYAKKIPTYINGDINKRYAHVVPEAENAQEEQAEAAEILESIEQGETRQEESRVFSMPQQRKPAAPARTCETPDYKISIYDRYMHVNPEEKDSGKK